MGASARTSSNGWPAISKGKTASTPVVLFAHIPLWVV